jgi:hypothetical protein
MSWDYRDFLTSYLTAGRGVSYPTLGLISCTEGPFTYPTLVEGTLYTEQELFDHVNYTDNWLVISAILPMYMIFDGNQYLEAGPILVSGAGEGNGTYTWASSRLWSDGGDYRITFYGEGEVEGVEYGFWVLYNDQTGKAYWSEDDTTGLVFPTTGWIPGDGGKYGGPASSPAPTSIAPPPEVTHICVYDPAKFFTLAEWQYYDGLGSLNAQFAPAKDEAGDWIYDANNNLKLFPPV